MLKMYIEKDNNNQNISILNIFLENRIIIIN